MGLTHEIWREPGAQWDAVADSRAVVTGQLDPIEVRDGRVQVRSFKGELYGHHQGPYFPHEETAAQEDEKSRIEFEQLMVDRLQQRRAELLARSGVLAIDPAYQARGEIERAHSAVREAALVCENLETVIAERAIGQTAIGSWVSRRFGSLYEYETMLRNAQGRRAAAQKTLDELHAQVARIPVIDQELFAIKKELSYIDHDLPMHEQRLEEYVQQAHRAGRVRWVDTGARPHISPKPKREKGETKMKPPRTEFGKSLGA